LVGAYFLRERKLCFIRHKNKSSKGTLSMRNAGRLKLGYYPLPTQEGHRLRWLLQSTKPFSAIDPCVGTGAALRLITADFPCRRYGIELDAERALAASQSGIETVQGNLFDAHAKVESFSLLYLNPPYDSGKVGTLNNQRMELLFLEHTYRWLVHGGVLLFVVPEKRLSVCIPLLAANFTGFRLFQLNDPESIRFEQVVLAAVRKPMRGDAMEAIALCCND
jgi:tRNA1(Val) A37 N6-methylase TrmN6